MSFFFFLSIKIEDILAILKASQVNTNNIAEIVAEIARLKNNGIKVFKILFVRFEIRAVGIEIRIRDRLCLKKLKL